jgi:hypothetical protein
VNTKALAITLTMTIPNIDLVSSDDPRSREFEQLVARDLAFLRSLKFSGSTPKTRKTFGSIESGEAFAQYFERYIKQVKLSIQDSWALAQVRDSLKNTMVAYPAFSQRSQIERLAVLIHEAQHASTDPMSRHVLCPSPFVIQIDGQKYPVNYVQDQAGKEACDDDDSGAYAVEADFFLNVALFCENCSAEMKSEAENWFVYTLLRITNPAALDRLLIDTVVSPANVQKVKDSLIRTYAGKPLSVP